MTCLSFRCCSFSTNYLLNRELYACSNCGIDCCLNVNHWGWHNGGTDSVCKTENIAAWNSSCRACLIANFPTIVTVDAFGITKAICSKHQASWTMTYSRIKSLVAWGASPKHIWPRATSIVFANAAAEIRITWRTFWIRHKKIILAS